MVPNPGTHIGGVLQQLMGDNWQPLSLFSQKLSAAEQKYSAFDRELLAAYSAIATSVSPWRDDLSTNRL